MTREEAKDIAIKGLKRISDRHLTQSIADTKELIDKIYDYIDTPTKFCNDCSECDRSKVDEQTFYKGYCNTLLVPVYLSFGCIHFRQKEAK